jgi:hypothetical protein
VSPDDVVINGCNRTLTRTYTATDGCGNTSTCSQVLTYKVDITPPVFTYCPPDQYLGCNPELLPGCGAATATDDCGSVTITNSLNPTVANGCNYSQSYTIKATDACGNTAHLHSDIYLDHRCNASNVYILPGQYEPELQSRQYSRLALQLHTDVCTGTPVITSVLNAETGAGCNRITYPYLHRYGCMRQYGYLCSDYTYVVDVTPPVFTFCPPSTFLGCNQTEVVPPAGIATATDACGNPTVTSSLGEITINGCIHSQSYTYTATDNCGNTSSCVQTTPGSGEIISHRNSLLSLPV